MLARAPVRPAERRSSTNLQSTPASPGELSPTEPRKCFRAGHCDKSILTGEPMPQEPHLVMLGTPQGCQGGCGTGMGVREGRKMEDMAQDQGGICVHPAE